MAVSSTQPAKSDSVEHHTAAAISDRDALGSAVALHVRAGPISAPSKSETIACGQATADSSS